MALEFWMNSQLSGKESTVPSLQAAKVLIMPCLLSMSENASSYSLVFPKISFAVILCSDVGSKSVIACCDAFLNGGVKPVLITRSAKKNVCLVGESPVPCYSMARLGRSSITHALNASGVVMRDDAHKGLLLSLSSPWLVKPDVLSLFSGLAINFHHSDLPRYRGGSTVSWQIMNGAVQLFGTLHFMTEEIDQGDIISSYSVKKNDNVRYPKDWHEFFDEFDPDFLSAAVSDIVGQKEFLVEKQSEQQSSYIPRLYAPQHSWIDWGCRPKEIENFVLSFSYPYAGARTFLGSDVVVIMDLEVNRGAAPHHPFSNGLIIGVNEKELLIACCGEKLAIQRRHFHSQATPSVGDRLHTPGEYLDRARSGRAFFNDGRVSIVGALCNEKAGTLPAVLVDSMQQSAEPS